MKQGQTENKEMLKLRAASADYFSQPKLGEAQLEKFEHLLGHQATAEIGTHEGSEVIQSSANASQVKLTQTKTKAWGRWFALAACILLVIGVMLNQGHSNIPLKIANEVAMNHIKMKPLEVTSNSLYDLRGYFTELDFSVTFSNEFPLTKGHLLGGRYCSIQGVSAAQIRYQAPTDESKVTLYQVGYDEQKYGDIPNIEKGETPLTLQVKGVQVRLWVEKGLLMAEASQL